MNVKKTKTMLISTNPMKKNVKVSDTTLEQAKQFKYHDTQITEKVRREDEIKCKRNLTKAKFDMMTKDLTSHKLSTPLKLRLTNCNVFCIQMYGAETWNLTTTSEKNTEAFEI